MRLLKIILFLLPLLSYGQKDKKGGYGAHTTQYFTERDIIFGNDTAGTPLDTTFAAPHIYEFNLLDNEWKQDLGNIGTAMQPMYYQSPAIGSRLGMHVYDAYAFDNEDIRYFDTRSPYTKLYYVQGFRGQQIFDVAFSRNINPTWNMGFEFQRITSKFQYGALEELNQTSNYAFQAYTKFSSKNHRYQLLANITRLDQSVVETGGINRTLTDNIYDNEDAIPNMLNSDGLTPESSDNRVNYHLYHQYDILGQQKLNVFHTFDRQKQWTRYRDTELENNRDYYGKPARDTTRTDYTLTFEKYDNSLGVKGWVNKLFYRLYGTHRVYRYWIDSLNWETEQFYGGDINYALSDSMLLENHLEVSTNKEYDFHSRFSWNNLTTQIGAKAYRQGLFTTAYFGNFDSWRNSFENTKELTASLDYHFNFGSQYLGIGYLYQRVTDLLYFNASGRPEQDQNTLNINSLYLELKLSHRFLHFDHYSRYYHMSGSDAWRAPTFFTKNSLYVDSRLFKNVLQFKLGGDLYYKTAYNAYGYDPVIQQFYLQNLRNIGNYPVLDLFIDFNIKVADLFFKVSHVNQGWWGDGGYEATPGYVGTRRTFFFGVRWRFYD